MLAGGWNITISKVGTLPEKVASGFVEAFNGIIGATYTPLFYVGNQVVNGTNHMVIAEQNLIVKDGATNIVKVVLNEKPIDEVKSSFSIVSIDVITEAGGALGGKKVDVSDISSDEINSFNDATSKLLGANYTPVAKVATQVVNGTNTTYLAEQILTTGIDVKHLVEITIYTPSEGDSVVLSITTIA